MWRSSVLLPQPLPPMMMKMSPRATVKLRSRCRTKEPKAIVRSSTTIGGAVSAMSVPMPPASDAEDVGEHGEQTVGDDDPHDRGDHRGRGGRAHGRRAAAALDTAQTAGHSDDDPEDHALA